MTLVTAILIFLPTQALGWVLFWAAGVGSGQPLRYVRWSYVRWPVTVFALLLVLVVPLLILAGLDICDGVWVFYSGYASCIPG